MSDSSISSWVGCGSGVNRKPERLNPGIRARREFELEWTSVFTFEFTLRSPL
jgi:hypothetical protein